MLPLTVFPSAIKRLAIRDNAFGFVFFFHRKGQKIKSTAYKYHACCVRMKKRRIQQHNRYKCRNNAAKKPLAVKFEYPLPCEKGHYYAKLNKNYVKGLPRIDAHAAGEKLP